MNNGVLSIHPHLQLLQSMQNIIHDVAGGGVKYPCEHDAVHNVLSRPDKGDVEALVTHFNSFTLLFSTDYYFIN
jgi:hypothetical protein